MNEGPRPPGWFDRRAAVVVAFALLLRLFRRAPVWPSSDAGDLPEFVRDRVCSPGHLGKDLGDLLNYRLGGVQPLVSYAEMLLARIAKLRILELGWELPSILVGCLVVYLAFLTATELAGEGAGLAAAALFAVSPLDIMESRHLGAPWMYEQLLQLLIVWVQVRLRRPQVAFRRALPILLGVYFWAGNQMLGLFPVVAYGAIALFRERDPGESLGRHVSARYGTPWWAFTASSGIALSYDTFALHRGHLFHALFEKRHVLGWYGRSFWQDLEWDLGRIGVWMMAAAFVLSLFTSRRLFSVERLPQAMVAAFTAPFLFNIPPGSTFTRGYIVYGVNAGLLAAGVAVYRLPLPRVAAGAFATVFSAVLLSGAGQSVYGLFRHPLLGTRNFHGSHVANMGFKAAASWVRTHAGPRDTVFSDASGGGGLEPPLMAMYFHLPYLALYDAPMLAPYYQFRGQGYRIAFLVIQAKNRGLAQRMFGAGFREAALVSTPERGHVLSIFDRVHEGPPELVSSAVADLEFDRRYSLLCD